MAVSGTSNLSGGHEYLPRGTIGVSEPRELVALRSVAGAYEPDGTLAWDTLRWSTWVSLGLAPVPDRLVPDEEVVEVLEEEVIWGGDLSGHYGHFLVESVARMWPVVPGAELEGRPVVFRLPRREPFIADWLEGFGAETIFLPRTGAVRFKRMRVPELSWLIGSWIAPEIRDVHLQARQGLEVPPTPRHDVLWLSRSGLPRKRIAYDEGLLEWILGDHVTPVQLETMPLAEQIGTLESSRAVTGAVGSAFHTLVLTADTPDCLYLCPSSAKSPYPAQHWLLGGDATFVQALVPAAQMGHVRRQDFAFPRGHRFLIPKALEALAETAIPDLLEDPRVAAFARPERSARHGGSLDEIDAAVIRVLHEPFSVEARRRLGAMFDERGLDRCATEQLDMAVDLTVG